MEMRAATERLADIVGVGAHVKAFAAHDAEIYFRQRDSINAVAVNVHETRLAFDDLSLAREFIKRNAAVFFGRDHRGQLIEIAAEFFKRSANFVLSKLRHGTLLQGFTLSILRVGDHASTSVPTYSLSS